MRGCGCGTRRANACHSLWGHCHGVALLVAGYDDDGPQLYYADPSGTFALYKAKAMGSGGEGAQSNLQESYSESMTFSEAEVLALSTLKQVMEDKLTTENIDVAAVTKDGFRVYDHDEITAVVSRLTTTAAPA